MEFGFTNKSCWPEKPACSLVNFWVVVLIKVWRLVDIGNGGHGRYE